MDKDSLDNYRVPAKENTAGHREPYEAPLCRVQRFTVEELLNVSGGKWNQGGDDDFQDPTHNW